jgi:hypothetical protein
VKPTFGIWEGQIEKKKFGWGLNKKNKNKNLGVKFYLFLGFFFYYYFFIFVRGNFEAWGPTPSGSAFVLNHQHSLPTFIGVELLSMCLRMYVFHGDNFNSVEAESGVFLPANENLTRKPETKKIKRLQYTRFFHLLQPTSLQTLLIFSDAASAQDERCCRPKAAAHAGTSEKIPHR